MVAPPATTPPNRARSLKEVRAAQLRARLLRRGIGQLGLGTLFLAGALSFGVGPRPLQQSSLLWMTFLAVVSTVHVGTGLRIFFRVGRWPRRIWPAATLAWGVLLTIVLRYLALP